MAVSKTSAPARALYFTLAVCTLGVFAFATVRAPKVIPALLGTWDEIRNLERSNAELEHKVKELRDRVKRMKENPDELEPEIRRLLEMQKKGEVDFKIQTAPPAKEKQ